MLTDSQFAPSSVFVDVTVDVTVDEGVAGVINPIELALALALALALESRVGEEDRWDLEGGGDARPMWPVEGDDTTSRGGCGSPSMGRGLLEKRSVNETPFC